MNRHAPQEHKNKQFDNLQANLQEPKIERPPPAYEQTT